MQDGEWLLPIRLHDENVSLVEPRIQLAKTSVHAFT
jgi:hypothetical protein